MTVLFDSDVYRGGDGSGGDYGDGDGWTANEIAEKLAIGPRTRRIDGYRRRVQELQQKYRLLDIAGVKEDPVTGNEVHTYRINAEGRRALESLDSLGYAFATNHLARAGDPETSAKAARRLRKETHFHAILAFLASR